MFVVVSYDIVDDKARNKIAKILLDYGTRVQYSVFECNLDSEQLAVMERRLMRVLNGEEDTIRIYLLCEGCVKRIRVFGKGDVTKDQEVYVV